MKCCIVIFLLLTVQIFPQPERNTKGAGNGYAWLTLGDPALPYSISKENYLSSILERLKITNEKHPEISSLDCRDDLDSLGNQGKLKGVSMNDIVVEMDKFYSAEENLVIPIIFAYCYTIKKFAGANDEELLIYKDEVLLFCDE